MKKIALIIGHSRLRQGARNKKSRLTEYQYNKKFVEKLYEKLLHIIDFNCYFQFQIFYRKIGMKTLHKRINKYKPDLAIEFHCNAFNEKISGSEIIINSDSFEYELQGDLYDLCQEVTTTLCIPNRGLKPTRKKDKGGKFLYNVNAELKFIAEPFFIDNDSDLEKALNNQDRLINIFANFIERNVEW